jgi:hypothetical protein
MKSQTLVLREYAGQHANVEITVRENGSAYVTFETREGFGYPSLELAELERLVAKAKALRDAA